MKSIWHLSIVIFTAVCCLFVQEQPMLAGGAANENAASCEKDVFPRSFSGNVSWYGSQFNGRMTASGEVFDMNKLTAAHRTMPFFIKVLVEDPKTGLSVIVKVNDRGPYAKNRVMDLSREGARRLGILAKGITYADCLVLDDNGANMPP